MHATERRDLARARGAEEARGNGRRRWSGATAKRLLGLVLVVGVCGGGTVGETVARPGEPGASSFPGGVGALSFRGNTGGGGNIFRMDSDGFGQTALTTTNDATESAWSADATRLLVTRLLGGTNVEIFRMNAAGGNQVNLANHPSTDFNPAWFPGDRRFVFASNRAGGFDLFAQGLDAAGALDGPPVRLTTNAANDTQPAVSPSGKLIAFTSNRGGNVDIFVIRANAPEGPRNKAVRLTKQIADDSDPDWSPDGRRIAFGSDRDGDEEIYGMNADGTKQTNLSRSGATTDEHPVWSPSGKQIAFDRTGGAITADLFRMRPDGSRQVNMTESAGSETFPSWQPLPD
jgi:Tol biopolymer transport system component